MTRFICPTRPQNRIRHTALRVLVLSVLFLMFAPCVFARQSTNRVLRHLDHAIDSREQYIAEKEASIEHTKSLMSVAEDRRRFDICASLVVDYLGFDIDSAFYYSKLCVAQAGVMGNPSLQQRAMIYQAQCFSVNCMFDRAVAILMPMSSTLYAENKTQYYRACMMLYTWEAEFTTISDVSDADLRKVASYRKLLIETEPSAVLSSHQRALLLAETDARAALSLLLPVFQSLPGDDENVRLVAYSIGSFYDELSMPDSALHYFALSAISDLEHGIMEHASLREAALILYRRGDVGRAYRYMNCCIEDAQFCKARLRTIQMADDMPMIMESYQLSILSHRRRMVIVVSAMLLALLLLIGLCVYAFVSRRRQMDFDRESVASIEQMRVTFLQQQSALASLEQANRSLCTDSRIGSAFIAQYMKQCSEVIDRMEAYHAHLSHTASRGTAKQLQAAIASSDYIDECMREMYQHFDETFLSLFPHYVESFNLLLRSDALFDIPRNGHLSTELRIFALIRLGITDSDDIARYLRLSTKTVYNYRASVRNRAAGERDSLEQQVMQIGCK